MLSADSGAAVLLPQYRLAPEHRFPAAVDDAVTVLRHAATKLQSLVPDAAGLAVVGDSAGGNLAGVAALECSEVGIVGQVLVYPVCDCDLSRASYAEHSKGLPLSREDMDWFFTQYVGENVESRADPRIALLRRPDLAKAAPTLVMTAEYDVLCDEGEALAAVLGHAGVDVTLIKVGGLAHGFIRLGNVLPPAREAIRAAALFARQRLVQAAAR
jgi:acetyl esterase